MDEEPVNVIRESSRLKLKLNRRFHRDEEADSRRHVASTSITPQRIEEIAGTLKTKSPISVAELQNLKNGLMEDPKNIEIMLNTHGALRGLVRELTGNDVNKQCAAAGCFCNLGLADSKAGAAVSKAAGTYLVTALDSLTMEMAVTCAWAVGNLAGSGSRATELLVAQGALTKLCDLVLSTNEELKDAAIYALVHCAYQMKDELKSEHLTKIIESLSKSEITIASCQLLFILSCHQDFQTTGLPEIYLQKLLTELPISIQTHLHNCQNICTKDCKLLYQIRILANIGINDRYYSIFVEYFSQIIEGFKILLSKEDVVTNSTLWLLGKLYNLKSDNVFFNELLR